MKIIEILDELGIEYREAGESPHVTQGWIGLICPFCGQGSDKYGLGIHLDYGNSSCWKCGTHKLADVLQEATGRPWYEIKKLLGGLERGLPRPVPLRGKLILPTGLGPLQNIHRDYLSGRGFDPD